MDGQNIINEIAFSQPVINIGADGGNDIILRGQGISDFHLMLNYASNVWHLVPLDPSSSTLVNGRGIGPEGCSVQSGAVISVGDYRLTLSLNGIYADIMVAQIASSVPYQSNVINTEEPEGSSILLSLSDKLVPAEIEAGTAIEYELTVTNAGPLVANMQLQVQGIPSAWVQIIPPVLNLNEGRSGNFIVRVTPPHTSAAKAGLYQLHFVATSPNYPRETGVADAMLTILPYSDFLVNGPTPRRLNLSRSHSSDFTDLIIINNSNAASTFTVRSYDDANELNYAYKQNSGNLVQGQITMTVNPGDNDRLPIQVETRKRPLIGLTNHFHHYYTTVTPVDRPGDAQSLLGEVTVRPMIHVVWLLIAILLLAAAALVFLQPYIHQFDSLAGKRTEVVMAGNSVGMNWNVSRFASKITLDDGKEARQVTRQGNEFVSPAVSTTYTLKAENFLSNLIGMKFEKEFHVLLIPRRPTIDVFHTDTIRTNYSKPVRLSWGVSSNASTAAITTNKQEQPLTAENYSGNQSNTYLTDTLISLKAVNMSGYEEKSVFVNVRPDKITLKRFVAWVRPNGIAVPSNNDIRRTTRWGSLQLYAAATPAPQTIRPAVNPQPDAQSNAILIPDNYGTSGSAQGGINPEQQSVNRILSSKGSDGLLVGPYTDVLPTSTPVPTAKAAPTAAVSVRSPIVSSSAPSNSPESGAANREFSIKLVEIVEDPIAESGYRVISYFPDYVLQKGEQIRVEWEIEGLNQITIENLSSGNLTAEGAEFAYPEKSTNYVLNAEIGDLKKTYSLPVNVAGEADDGEGSGLNCNLKANSTTLAVPGTVMLTWTGGGNNRVQLLSSIQAEKENTEAEKKKEAEAKEKGEKYTQPTNAPLSGGIIGDYLEPSGFMRVNVDKQTTFVLNAYDGNGNIICSKDVEIKYTGGNDKLDLKLAITKISDTNDVSQPYYTVGQTVQFTVALTDFKKGQDPTGSILLTDGDSTCTMTLPKNTCSMVVKHAGVRTITAVYGGDDAYNKKTATSSLTVRSKIDTKTEITSALKAASDLADLVTRVTYNNDLAKQYGKTPTGKITFTVGSGTCDLEIATMNISCGGTGTQAGNVYTVKNMILSDQKAATVRAKYSGDDYFNPSDSDTVNFATVPTKLAIENAYKHSAADIDLKTVLSWDPAKAGSRTPAGTITYTSGSAVCTLDLATLKFSECSGKAELGGDGIYQITGMAMKGVPGDHIYAEYRGDSFFDGAVSESVKFKSVPTDLALSEGAKDSAGLIKMKVKLGWTEVTPAGTKPKGLIKFVNNLTGSDVCMLAISENPPKFTDGCTGNVGVTVSDQNIVFDITNMNSNGRAGDEIKAVYSGDDYFLTSESNVIDFNKIDTTIAVIDALKNGVDYADIRALLSWDPNAAGGAEPTGTVKFTAGGGSCTLDIVTEVMDCEPKTGLAETDDPNNPKEMDIRVVKMLLADNKADRVKVDYSGDAVFNPSSSTTVLFRTAPTTVTIGTAVKPDASHANVLQLRLNWNWNDVRTMVNKVVDPSIDRKPEGTITLTVGSGSCLLDAATGKLSGCSGTSGAPTLVTDGSDAYYNYAISGMALSDKEAKAIKASYAGDGFFLSSSSDTIDFSQIPTEITITQAYKSDTDHANVDTDLTWDPNGTQGLQPTGTIKLTIRNGSSGAGDVVTGTCILDLSTKKLNCDSETPSVVTADGSVTSAIMNMLLADKNADRIKAEYSGDTLFKASESTVKLFTSREKIDTVLELSEVYRAGSGLLNAHADLSWPVKDENGDPINDGLLPTGTITFTIGGDTCKLVFDDASAGNVKDFNCSLKDVTKIDPTSAPSDPDQVITWALEKILLSAGSTADRVKAEYSGDANFNPSTSEFVLMETVPTVIEIMAFKGQDAEHADIYGILSWDDSDNTMQVQPKGTVKFTVGSGTCTLNLETKAVSCEHVSADVDPWSPGLDNLGFYVEDMLLVDKNAELVSAEYSGDGYFEPSTSATIKFDENDLTVKITKITDENGKEHSWFVPGQKIKIEVDLTDYAEGVIPTGKVSISGDGITCPDPIDWSPTKKLVDCTIGQQDGNLPILAAYAGDNYYAPQTADGTVPVQPKATPKLTITKITDKNSVEQPEYYINEEVHVTVDITDYEQEPATGIITVTAVNLDDFQHPVTVTCNFRLPNNTCPLNGLSKEGKYVVTAKYDGDTYYNSVITTDAPKEIAVTKYGLSFEITEITNTNYIQQPYYVIDQKANRGQDAWIFVKVSDYGSDDPSGQVEIKYVSYGNMENTLCGPFNWPGTTGCRFNVSTLGTGEKKLKAYYSHDPNYADRTAETTIVVQNKIETEPIIQTAHRMLDDNLFAEIELEFMYDRTIPEKYPDQTHGPVSPDIDWTKSPEADGIIIFTFKDTVAATGTSKTCAFDLETEQFTDNCQWADAEKETIITSMVNENSVSYYFKNVYTSGATWNEIKAEYRGNHYFYESSYGPEPYGVEDQGETGLGIASAVKLGTDYGYAFFDAALYYDAEVAAKYNKRPADGIGKLTLTPIGGSSPACTWDFATASSAECDKLTVETNYVTRADGNLYVEFTIGGMPITGATTAVSIRYSADQYFLADEQTSDLAPEAMPTIDISYAVKPGANSADVAFKVNGIGAKAEKYHVFDQIRATVSADGTSWTKTKYVFGLPGGSDQCGGTVSQTADGYKLGGWSISYDPNYFSGAEYVQLELRSSQYTLLNNDPPADQEQFGLETQISLDKLLKAHSCYFLESYLTYDPDVLPGIKPTGKIKFTFLREDGTVYPTQESVFEYNVSDSGVGTLTNVIKGLYVQWGPVKVYAEYLGDGYYKPSRSETTAIGSEADPQVTVRNAVKYLEGTRSNHVYAAFDISGMGTLWEYYGVISQISLKSGGTTVDEIIFKYSDLSKVTLQYPGTLRQNESGTYIAEDLVYDGLNFNDHTYLQVHLYSPYRSVDTILYGIGHYQKMQTELTPRTSEAFRILNNHAFMTTELHILDQTARRLYGKEPGGTVTFIAGTSVCTYTFPEKFSETDTGTFSPCTGSVHTYGTDKHFTLRVTDWEIPNGVTQATITYSGNGFYTGGSKSVSLPEKTPRVTINSAVKTSPTTADVVFTIDNYFDQSAYRDYLIYNRLLIGVSGSVGYMTILPAIASGAFTREELSGIISRDGNKFTIWDLTIHRVDGDNERYFSTFHAGLASFEGEYDSNGLSIDVQKDFTRGNYSLSAPLGRPVSISVDLDLPQTEP